MKKYIFLIIVFSAAIFSSCSDYVNCSTYDFSDCPFDEPVSSDLYIEITIDEENDSVPVEFYIGRVEDGILDTAFIATENEYIFELPVNEYYSAKAEYISHGKKVFAIDGGEMRTYQTTKCDEYCWEIEGDVINIKLKYEGE